MPEAIPCGPPQLTNFLRVPRVNILRLRIFVLFVLYRPVPRYVRISAAVSLPIRPHLLLPLLNERAIWLF